MIEGIGYSSGRTSNVEKKSELVHIHKNIFEYNGKTAMYKGVFYQLPTLQELAEKGFGYFEENEKYNIIENEKKIQTEQTMEAAKRKIQAEGLKTQMESMKAMLDSKIKIEDIRIGVGKKKKKNSWL